jgi:predicted amidohydrolase YtcJ
MRLKLSPDAILLDGRITTFDPNRPEATRIAFSNRPITNAGDAGEHEPDPNTKTIDLTGRRVTPGPNDSNLHVIRGGLNFNGKLHWLVGIDSDVAGGLRRSYWPGAIQRTAQ